MKAPSRISPHITVQAHGRVTWRMKVGVFVMRVGAWLTHNGGVRVTYKVRG